MTFGFHMPVKLRFGSGCVSQYGEELAALGSKALIVCGRNSARTNGSLGDVQQTLAQYGRTCVVFDQVDANPGIDCVYEGAAFARAQGVDFVVAVGGGSPMDAAKAIALLACQDVPREALFSGHYGPEVLPMAHVPTTAGTGSEVTPYAVLTNIQAQTKMSMASPVLFPKIAFLDPRYLAYMPKATAVHTAADALSHLVEGMLSVKANPLSDALALEGLRRLSACLTPLEREACTREDYEALLYASTLGGMVIAQTSTVAVHVMGYPLTYHHHLDHGLANGLLLPPFLRFTVRHRPERVDEILKALGLTDVEAFERRMKSLLGKPPVLPQSDLAGYARRCAQIPKIANTIVPPNQQDMLAIYQAALSE